MASLFPNPPEVLQGEVVAHEAASAEAVSGVTDTLGGVTQPVSGATDTVSGVTDTLGGTTGNLLEGEEKKSWEGATTHHRCEEGLFSEVRLEGVLRS
jgi:hypothetical protein